MMDVSRILLDCAVVSVVIWWVRRASRSSASTPPGPSGYPILGNVLDLKVPELWKAAQQWGNRYGGIIYLKSLNQPFVIVNSYDIAVELFERRSTNYSDRPTSVMVNELQKWDWMFSSKSYGEAFKALRAPVQRFFDASNIAHYEQAQKVEIKKLLKSLLKSPHDYESHIKLNMASTIMMITYGHEASSFDDPLVALARKASSHVENALQQGVYLVDVVPWLKYVPRWCPGAGFQVIAEIGAKLSHDLRYVTYYHARDETKLLKSDEELISATCGICYSAGASTSISTLTIFLLVMTLHPEVQRRAQEELDSFVGDSRLPELSDRAHLPYCNAMLKELHRWIPVLPLGVAHATKSSDIFEGHYIPAKTIVIPNQWAMLKDPIEYPDPEEFRPERFLPAPGESMPRDPTKVAFGFGRRACPGKPLAENTLFLVATQILTVFNIHKARKSDGTDIEPVVKIHSEGVVRHPGRFEFVIEPRSAEATTLIQLD